MAAAGAGTTGTRSVTEKAEPALGGSLINWSAQGLQKLPATLSCDAEAHTLILDKNQLIKLEHLENWRNLMQLSVANNRLVRMMGVAKLIHLRVLNLPHNSIGYIEGLKDLVHLEWLNLAGNNLKTIDQVNCCTSLQHLDLSDNNISQIGDISKLSSLKTLLLHGNIITSLRTAPSCLPRSLAILSLAENEIRDLNEVSFLASFPELEQLSIMNNPCVMATPSVPGFDYRPFIVSWCLGLKVLDGYVISQKESLKAEWLYSQGKGRSFRPGQHIQLVQYLAGVCPLTTMFGLQTAEDAKLEKILHKQRLHQRQLMCQSKADESPVSSALNKGASLHSGPNSPIHGPQITESEPTIKKNTWVATKSNDDHSYALKNVPVSSVQPEGRISKDLYLDDIQTDEDKLNSSLLSSESTFMPVASGLSPVSPTSADLQLQGVICVDTEEFIKHDKENQKTPVILGDGAIKTCADSVETQEEEEGTASISTLSAVTNNSSCPIFSEDVMKYNDPEQSLILEEISVKTVSLNKSLEEVPPKTPVILIQKEGRFEDMNKAATKLQACWRGYYTRNHHPRAKEVRYEIRLSRMQEHIMHLAEEVKKLRKEKDEEKLQRLVQEEAMKFLWDQVKHIQKWQLSVNPHLSSICQHPIPPSNVLGLSEMPMESSRLNQAPSPVDSSTWLMAPAENCHQKYLSQFPDSGFHSCVTDQNCLNESLASEENAEETYGDSSVENSLETIKRREDNLSRCPSETQEVQLGLGEYSKESFSGEHENSLLQQYLKSVEQLDNADDKSVCSSETQISRAVLSEEPYRLCSAVSGSEEMFSSVHNGTDHTVEICSLNAEIAEEKQSDTEASLQVLPVSITV